MNTRFALLSILAVTLTTACTKTPPKLEVSPDSISLYSGKTEAITTNADDAVFTSEDEFYATVSEAGVVTGGKVGETLIYISSSIGNASVKVEVKPQYSLYPEVDGYIGKSLTAITSAWGNDYKISGTLYGYTNPVPNVALVAFGIENGICKSVSVLVSTSQASLLTNYLTERYKYATRDDDYFYFFTHKDDVIIGLGVYSAAYYSVYYLPNTTKASYNDLPSNLDCFL